MRWFPPSLFRLASFATFEHVFALECSPSAIQSALPSNATVNFAYSLPANSTFKVPEGDLAYPTHPTNLPPLCAVSVQVQSIGNSTFNFGLFLPENWNGRFLAVGNGGFAGGINWLDMAPGTRSGFATISTDTGHNSRMDDGTWAYQSPEKIENWGHLAMHGSVVTAKKLVAAFYGTDISYNYYAGCSTGGRQGLKEAQMYPDDFDAIIAGAPAWWTSGLQPWTVKVGLFNLPVGAEWHIPEVLFPVIGKEVMKQCDPQDGVEDGVISDPSACVFRPETLLCPPNSTNSTAQRCLTAPQISTLNKIYSEVQIKDPALNFPHLELGSEWQWSLLRTDTPGSLGVDYVRYFLGLGPDWNPFEYTDDIQRMAARLDPGNATVSFDLSAFHAKGGKVLSYHGMSDGLIPTGTTPYFYDHVAHTLAPKNITMDDFFRYFLVPGMGHCAGTHPSVNAPWYFGGPQASSLAPSVSGVPGFDDEEHDIMLAMMAWVEEGRAPEHIVATKYVNDKEHTEVLRQRPLCMWPRVAKYMGGDVDDVGTWECVGS